MKSYKTGDEKASSHLPGAIGVGETVYLVQSKRAVREATVIRIDGDLYSINFHDSTGGIRVRRSRLYRTKEEAESQLIPPQVIRHHNIAI